MHNVCVCCSLCHNASSDRASSRFQFLAWEKYNLPRKHFAGFKWSTVTLIQFSVHMHKISTCNKFSTKENMEQFRNDTTQSNHYSLIILAFLWGTFWICLYNNSSLIFHFVFSRLFDSIHFGSIFFKHPAYSSHISSNCSLSDGAPLLRNLQK